MDTSSPKEGMAFVEYPRILRSGYKEKDKKDQPFFQILERSQLLQKLNHQKLAKIRESCFSFSSQCQNPSEGSCLILGEKWHKG